MTDDIKKYAEYIAEYGNGMVRCKCGLAVANDKMGMHLKGEHFVKNVSDIIEARKRNE